MTPPKAEIDAAKNALRERLQTNGRLTGCTSYVQRKLGIGYNQGARIMEHLEKARFITAPDEHGERRFVKPESTQEGGNAR